MKRVLVPAKKIRWVPQERQFCNYVHRVCMQSRLEGYNYCIRHILEDKSAPFRQCTFVHIQSGQRCTNAAPRSEKKDSFLCPWHSKVAHRSRGLAQRKPPGPSAPRPQILLEVLEHHCPQTHLENSNESKGATDESVPTRLLDAYESCSESDSENDLPLHNYMWKREVDSDPESSDSELDDPLKHAGIYTAEEAALILRDKLVRLQSLYLGQFKRLEHVWKERHIKYLHALKAEEGLELQNPVNKSQQYKYRQKLKALRHYHRPQGNEALLQWKLRLKRLRAHEKDGKANENAAPDTLPKCSYQQPSVGPCGMAVLPYSKYCRKHILQDSRQVLYRPCQPNCSQPVGPLTSSCPLHTFEIDPLTRVFNLSEDQWVGPSSEAPKQTELAQEPELFQTMDDIAALGLDVVQPGSLFGLNQFGEFGESSECSLAVDMGNILCDNGKNEKEVKLP